VSPERALAKHGGIVSTDDLRPQAREIVDIARRARTPTAEDHDRIYQTLMAGLAGGAAAGASSAAAATAKVVGKSSLLWLKWALPAALLSSGVVGTYAYRSTHHVDPAASPTITTAMPVDTSKPVDPPAPAEVAAPALQPEPSVRTEARAKAQTSPKAIDDELAADVALLHEALGEWRAGHAARALELSREHARRFPSSQVRSERSALQVRALCALGRDAEARKIADQLRSQAPGSPAAAALKDTCAAK